MIFIIHINFSMYKNDSNIIFFPLKTVIFEYKDPRIGQKKLCVGIFIFVKNFKNYILFLLIY
jgi:hypothetical protein